MTTEQVYVKNDGSGLAQALHVTDAFIVKQHLSKRDTMHVRLLAEEMLGMVRAITGEFKALFWVEGNNEECRIKLNANVEMDSDKRRGLMSASTSGKNASTKGIMGKIREIVEIGMENYEDVSRIQAEYGVDPINYGMMGIDNEMMSQAVLAWSLRQYRDNVYESKDESEAYEEAWDELEKSVIANLADDVCVGILKDKVEITITKHMTV